MTGGVYTVRYFRFTALLAFSVLPSAGVQASGDWHRDTVQGFEKYWTQTSDGARFIIWCNRSRKLAGTVVDIDINGRNAPSRKPIRVVVDHNMVVLPADNKGYVQTDCAACADRFRLLWNRLRTGIRLSVQFDDRRFAAFSLQGAADVLDANPCPADYEKR